MHSMKQLIVTKNQIRQNAHTYFPSDQPSTAKPLTNEKTKSFRRTEDAMFKKIYIFKKKEKKNSER